METKHTNGPWSASGYEADYNGRRTYDWSVGAGNTPICSGYANLSENFPKLEEGEYNARLIAAAPDMLAVLERASHINGFREFNDYLPTIRAAIAKATGEQA